MNSYLKITGRTFTIWLMAAFINAILCGCCRVVPGAEDIPGEICLSLLLSLFLLAPVFFIFWIVMLVCIYRCIYERALFRAALSSVFILAIATGVICLKICEEMPVSQSLIIMAFALISTITSIMLHFKYFKSITQ